MVLQAIISASGGLFWANSQRIKHVVITSKRRSDVIITGELRFVFGGMLSRPYETTFIEIITQIR